MLFVDDLHRFDLICFFVPSTLYLHGQLANKSVSRSVQLHGQRCYTRSAGRRSLGVEHATAILMYACLLRVSPNGNLFSPLLPLFFFSSRHSSYSGGLAVAVRWERVCRVEATVTEESSYSSDLSTPSRVHSGASFCRRLHCGGFSQFLHVCRILVRYDSPFGRDAVAAMAPFLGNRMSQLRRTTTTQALSSLLSCIMT